MFTLATMRVRHLDRPDVTEREVDHYECDRPGRRVRIPEPVPHLLPGEDIVRTVGGEVIIFQREAVDA